MSATAIIESVELARQIRSEHGWRMRLVRLYWRLCFSLTRLLEKHFKRNMKVLRCKSVMNYGCGNKFYEQAINVDLFAPHRFLLGKRRPDMYWSGTVPAFELVGQLDTVVCEHVIEHMMPDDAMVLLKNFHGALKQSGVLVLSFPDVGKVLSGGLCQGYHTTSATLNSLIYRHGHCFMYDTALVKEMLISTGFNNVRVAEFDELPLKQFIGEGRADETSYLVAACGTGSH